MNPRVPYGLDLIESCAACPMSASSGFCHLDLPTLGALDAIGQSTVYPKGAVLFVAGQPARGAFVVCAGRAKLTLTSPRGTSMILGLAGSGEVLGLDAVLSRTPYQVGAETLQPSQIKFIPGPQLTEFFDSHDAVKARVAECLASELRRARAQAARVALARSVESRLAGLLMEMAESVPRGGRGIRFQLGLTHEEIGALIGTSRETVSRVLADFRRRDVVRIKGGLVTIPEPARLAAIDA